MKIDTDGNVMTTVKVEAKAFQKLKVLAAKRGKTLRALMKEALEELSKERK